MLERYLLDIEGAEMYDLRKGIELGRFHEVYKLAGPALEDMLCIQGEDEWMDFVTQQGSELEERPLCLHLAAWHRRCVEIGCYEGDVTEKLADYLRNNLTEEQFSSMERPAVSVDIDEPNGDLGLQLEPYRRQAEAWGCKLHAFFDDTYCAGLYFVFLEKPRPGRI